MSDASRPPPHEDDPGRPTSARRRTVVRAFSGIVAAATIGAASYGSITSAASGDDFHASMTLVAPAAAGGGWDTLAREPCSRRRRPTGLVNNVQVVNMPGAGGTIGLRRRCSTLEGQPDSLLVGGTGLLAATIQYRAPRRRSTTSPTWPCCSRSTT